jgi:hypothetical protein
MKPPTTPAFTALSPAGQAVVTLIYDRDHVTFAEIERRLEGLLELQGHTMLECPSASNIILWAGMSEPFAAVMQEVQASGLVTMTGTSLLVYLIDGKVWQLPIAKRLPKGGYRKPHWAPVCFRPTPGGRVLGGHH